MQRAIILIAVFLGASYASGCNRADADRLAKVGKIIVRRTDELTSGVREELQSKFEGAQRLHDNTVLARCVAQRISNDKLLQGEVIIVSASEATVRLQGEVSTTEQQQRAVNLAETTAGVAKVIDDLRLGRGSKRLAGK